MLIPLPSIQEQQRITEFLNASCAAIDAAVAAKRKQLETLDALANAIIHHTVTQGLNPTVEMKPSYLDWLAEVPAHWCVQQIKRKCVLVRGQFTHRPRNDPALYDGEYPFVQTGDISAARKYILTYSQTLNESGLSVSKIFPRGTLVMSIAANIGDVAILDFEACFPDSMIGMVNIRPTRLRKLPDQPIFEAFFQGIQPYVLDGNALLAGWAELAPPLGLADMNPVGRPVTGAREAVLFDKGFQHKRAVTIAMQPVIW